MITTAHRSDFVLSHQDSTRHARVVRSAAVEPSGDQHAHQQRRRCVSIASYLVPRLTVSTRPCSSSTRAEFAPRDDQLAPESRRGHHGLPHRRVHARAALVPLRVIRPSTWCTIGGRPLGLCNKKTDAFLPSRARLLETAQTTLVQRWWYTKRLSHLPDTSTEAHSATRRRLRGASSSSTTASAFGAGVTSSSAPSSSISSSGSSAPATKSPSSSSVSSPCARPRISDPQARDSRGDVRPG